MRIVSRSKSGAMNDVVTATMTTIEYISWFKIPSDSPMVATTSSIAPRAFMATAMDRLSPSLRPPSRLPRVQPMSFPAVATPSTWNSIDPSPSCQRSTLSPTMPKKIGAKIE